MAHPPLRGMGYMTGAGARRRKPTSVTECRDSLARWGRGARGASRPRTRDLGCAPYLVLPLYQQLGVRPGARPARWFGSY